ncbi:RNA polymerase sigma factor [Allomuricauda sp. SCSIO 65647]|uniref:RNA polymerase sigma factor n=1 Tax=Allomuricauda sp. SCSIO 65647 TaxID=2908843 RepID=UPI001F3948E9|nr:RNA polymerase sigma factor [Muricauda sp. SCSIO 65647]UJH68820.1 RNA polymerase sigma factor [Muricauda sp. SCSIO 65647]
MNKKTDELLMQEVAQGNLEMLRILFDRHHLHVFNFLYKMSGDKMLSEDLTQDVFYKVIKYRSSYKNGRFLSWLFTIARNSLKTHFTRNKEMHTDLEQLADQTIEEKNDEAHSQLHLALSKLETSDREVIILNRFHEIRYQELAEIMGSTTGAMKTKVSRAMKKLKNIYLESI